MGAKASQAHPHPHPHPAPFRRPTDARAWRLCDRHPEEAATRHHTSASPQNEHREAFPQSKFFPVKTPCIGHWVMRRTHGAGGRPAGPTHSRGGGSGLRDDHALTLPAAGRAAGSPHHLPWRRGPRVRAVIRNGFRDAASSGARRVLCSLLAAAFLRAPRAPGSTSPAFCSEDSRAVQGGGRERTGAPRAPPTRFRRAPAPQGGRHAPHLRTGQLRLEKRSDSPGSRSLHPSARPDGSAHTRLPRHPAKLSSAGACRQGGVAAPRGASPPTSPGKFAH